jgi:signal transduction histidine kinase
MSAARHAGCVRATVLVRADDRAVQIEVVDEGSGTPAAVGTGLGLTGMRERVAYLAAPFRRAHVLVAAGRG